MTDACKHSNFNYGRVISVNGAVHVRRRCTDCHKIGDASLPHAEHPFLDSYPILRDNRTSTSPCVRCGAHRTELHHWAPRALFLDADDWPVAYLCVPCHQKWHAIINQRGAA